MQSVFSEPFFLCGILELCGRCHSRTVAAIQLSVFWHVATLYFGDAVHYGGNCLSLHNTLSRKTLVI